MLIADVSVLSDLHGGPNAGKGEFLPVAGCGRCCAAFEETAGGEPFWTTRHINGLGCEATRPA